MLAKTTTSQQQQQQIEESLPSALSYSDNSQVGNYCLVQIPGFSVEKTTENYFLASNGGTLCFMFQETDFSLRFS